PHLVGEPAIRHDKVFLDIPMCAVQLAAGSQIDLGGIVKGWSVDRLAKWLKQKGISRGLINAGGDLQVWGGFNHSEPWCVGIAHPFEEELDMAVVSLFDGAAATSNIVGR
ncbi:FAD:protein FMN transferase, partial [Microbacteriaceae bacterium K1510]|nr:FAD:protein FMN transferase [Microbacteriaceae bacterium K1510]